MNTKTRQLPALRLRPIAYAITAALGAYAPAAVNAQQRADNTVIEELAAGYLHKDEVLKFAEVKIAINKGSHR